MSAQKKIVIIAGPNGAGKTTFAREFLPFEADCPTFVNADLIAAGIAPFQPETVAFRAGRLMLQELAHHTAEGRSFAFETTLSGRTYAPMIDAWRASGYTVKLIFLSLVSADEAVARVANRVRQGGPISPSTPFAAALMRAWRTFMAPTASVSISGSCLTIAPLRDVYLKKEATHECHLDPTCRFPIAGCRHASRAGSTGARRPACP